MKVVIRHTEYGLYYAGQRHWVGDPFAAMEFGTIEQARELSRKESLNHVEVVTIFDDPARDFAPPLERKKAA